MTIKNCRHYDCAMAAVSMLCFQFLLPFHDAADLGGDVDVVGEVAEAFCSYADGIDGHGGAAVVGGCEVEAGGFVEETEYFYGK